MHNWERGINQYFSELLEVKGEDDIPAEALFCEVEVVMVANYWVMREVSATKLAFILILLSNLPHCKEMFWLLVFIWPNCIEIEWLLAFMVISRLWLWVMSSPRRWFMTWRESSRYFGVGLFILGENEERDESPKW